MKLLLVKELRLAASPLTFIFLSGSLMTLLPGYPILVGTFFVCLGLLYSFQNAREANDVLYTVLLPVKKSDFVSAKFAFACLIELTGFCLSAALTVLRMTALKDAAPYVENALMNPSPVYLAFVLLIFAAFNLFFIGGFFKTAHKIGIPFLTFGVAAFLLIGVAEVLHHLPGLGFLNVTSGEKLGVQFAVLAGGAVLYAGITYLSCRRAKARFEKTDL